MTDAYIVGVHCTPFGKHPSSSYKDLTREAYLGALADAAYDDGETIEQAWFGNCGMWTDGQGSIRGQVCFTPLLREGRFPERVPMVNVEGGCATASLALHGAVKDIWSNAAHTSLAIGVEKTFYPDAAEKTKALFDGGIDQYDAHEWQDYYRAAGEQCGKPFEPGPDRTVFMDTYAMQACYHMKKFGTTQAQIATGAAKNHCHGALNPGAQYRFRMTTEEVLDDRLVSYPLTRAMCAPIGDGAAAALVVSGARLRELPAAVRERAVRIVAQGLSGGKYRTLDEAGLSHTAAQKAYRMAGLTPTDISIAEVHDATSFCEIYQAEMMGFCAPGRGGDFIASGATALDGRLPINTSGGLVSKGHPVGATGLSMVYELCQQLRGDAGDRQVAKLRYALAENGGGVMGFDEAACSVLILEKPQP